MTFTKLVLVLPIAMFAASLLAGCGKDSTETQVIEAAPMTAEEEAAYEAQTNASMNDEAQN